MYQLQSILFDKSHWTKHTIKGFLDYANIKPMKGFHETQNYIRVRIKDPKKFSQFKTIKMTDNIEAVVGITHRGGDVNNNIGNAINGIVDNPLVKLATTFLPFLL